MQHASGVRTPCVRAWRGARAVCARPCRASETSAPTSEAALESLTTQQREIQSSVLRLQSERDQIEQELEGKVKRLRQLQGEIDTLQADVITGTARPSALRSMDATLEDEMRIMATIVLPEDPEADAVVSSGMAASDLGDSGHWAAACMPHTDGDGKQRVLISCVLAIPAPSHLVAPDAAALIWGVAPDGAAPWQEPPNGWRTEPETSWDVAKGAWGTRAAPVGSIMSNGSRLSVFRAVLNLPWRGSARRASGVAFKWQLGKAWLGDATTGGNLCVRTSYVKAFYSSAEDASSDSDSDGDDGVDLLSQLRPADEGRLRALEATPIREVPPAATTLASALDPWMQQPSPDAGAHEETTARAAAAVASQEPKARRSLMHRFNIATALVEELSLPDAAATAAAVDAARRAALLHADPSTSTHAPDLAAACAAEAALAVYAVWLRLTAARLLEWNHNYNVKPREISAAQTRLTAGLTQMWLSHPWTRGLVAVALSAVGRGGDGDMGQRIRDEILAIQSKNGAKGGMMEQWHQKLHNNTSPDDVVICAALLAYIDAGLDVSAYWATLHAAGIDAARLASYDRSITHEPAFSQGQAAGLRADLSEYMVTLTAVHGGHDLQAALLGVVGYSQARCKGKAISVEPVPGFPVKRLTEVGQALLLQRKAPPPAGSAADGAAAGASSNGASSNGAGSADASAEEAQQVERRLELLLEARKHCAEYLAGPGEGEARSRDVLYLDLALASEVRNTLEGRMQALAACAACLQGADGAPDLDAARHLVACLALACENFCWLHGDSEHAVCCLEGLRAARAQLAGAPGAPDPTNADVLWALHLATAAAERLEGLLTYESSRTLAALTPARTSLARALHLPSDRAEVAVEDTVRALPHAPASQLLAVALPALRAALSMDPWRIVAPFAAQGGTVTGRLQHVASLAEVQHSTYGEATVLVVDQVGGDEDVPQGCVAVLCAQSIDVLCHAALRARATGALVATCSDASQLAELVQRFAGQQVQLRQDAQRGAHIVCESWDGQARSDAGHAGDQRSEPQHNAHIQPQGVDLQDSRWTVEPADYSAAAVGSKAINLQALAKQLPDCIPTPPSYTLPFSALPRALAAAGTSYDGLAKLAGNAWTGGGAHGAIQTVEAMGVPDDMVKACRAAAERALGVSHSTGLLAAVKRVWASKWNARALRACTQQHVRHEDVHMSVLVQPLLATQAAFVSHSRDPRSGDARMYVEAMAGLGEGLVGNGAGRPVAFTVDTRALLEVLKVAADAAATPRLRVLGGEGRGESVRGWLEGLPRAVRARALETVAVESAQSKAWAVSPAGGAREAAYGLIARSASNMEDLGTYSGAGVFDSFPTAGSESRAAWGGALAQGFEAAGTLMLQIALASAEAAACLGGDQDVEGVVDAQGTVCIVQARPQV